MASSPLRSGNRSYPVITYEGLTNLLDWQHPDIGDRDYVLVDEIAATLLSRIQQGGTIGPADRRAAFAMLPNPALAERKWCEWFHNALIEECLQWRERLDEAESYIGTYPVLSREELANLIEVFSRDLSDEEKQPLHHMNELYRHHMQWEGASDLEGRRLAFASLPDPVAAEAQWSAWFQAALSRRAVAYREFMAVSESRRRLIFEIDGYKGSEGESRLSRGRRGKKMIAGYFSTALSRKLRTLAALEGRKLQSCMGEAWDMWLESRGETPFGER